VPAALDALVAQLLRNDPRDRYQTASAALADLIALSRTSIIIGTRFSSFSYVPAVWGDVPVIETGSHLRVIPWT
jgi:hypothetical protein